MYKKEGRSLVAKLSLGLGINIVGIVAIFIIITTVNIKNTYATWFVFSFLLADILFTTGFFMYVIYSATIQLIPYKKSVDYIIVLGSGITSEEVTPLLKSRLDKGIEFYNKNRKIKFVVSGGKGLDEPVSEAFAMRKYLVSQGVDYNHIIIEDRSTSTLQNMLYSKKEISHDWNKSRQPQIIFSTNNYHVLRASIYAKKAGIKGVGVGAPTSYYFLPSALIREYIAIIFENKLIVALFIIMIFLLVGITFLPFNIF